MQQTIAQAIAALDEPAALEGVRTELAAGRDPVAVIEECRQGITQVGEQFGRGEAYLSELIVTARLFQACMALLEPLLQAAQTAAPLGTVVIGTVLGDIHDLGKDIVATLLRCEGFAVVDLGVDVPPTRFVQAITETGATIVGLSCLLTTSYGSMKATVQALADNGLRQRTFVIIGGGPVDERVRAHVGADYCAVDAVSGVRACREYVQVRRAFAPIPASQDTRRTSCHP